MTSGIFKDWLENTIGKVCSTNRNILDPLHALREAGNFLATTNYDDVLLDYHNALLPITWMVQRLRDRLRRGFARGTTAWSDMVSVLADTIPGIRVVKADMGYNLNAFGWYAADQALRMMTGASSIQMEQFPYTVTPSTNEGAGQSIFEWLNHNIGEMDNRWTYLGREVRFRSEDDRVLYVLTWQR